MNARARAPTKLTSLGRHNETRSEFPCFPAIAKQNTNANSNVYCCQSQGKDLVIGFDDEIKVAIVNLLSDLECQNKRNTHQRSRGHFDLIGGGQALPSTRGQSRSTRVRQRSINLAFPTLELSHCSLVSISKRRIAISKLDASMDHSICQFHKYIRGITKSL